jgi:hypothetical protein
MKEMSKKRKLHYTLTFSLWQTTLSASPDKVLKDTLKFADGLGLDNADEVHWGISGTTDKGVVHVSLGFWFKKKIDWSKAIIAMKKVDGFRMVVPKNPGAINRVRVYLRNKEEKNNE